VAARPGPEISWRSARHPSPGPGPTSQAGPAPGHALGWGRHCRQGSGCRERAAVLFGEGHSASSVAEQLGVAQETVVSWRARWRRERAAALFEEGQTASAVAQRLGTARQPP
jgi:Putative ATPase subunit of terminase (gpP-like)